MHSDSSIAARCDALPSSCLHRYNFLRNVQRPHWTLPLTLAVNNLDSTAFRIIPRQATEIYFVSGWGACGCACTCRSIKQHPGLPGSMLRSQP